MHLVRGHAERGERGDHVGSSLISPCGVDVVMTNGLRCQHCQRELGEGHDVLEVTEGIMGMRGFVGLEKPTLFCSAECLKDHFSGEARKVYRMKRRVP